MSHVQAAQTRNGKLFQIVLILSFTDAKSVLEQQQERARKSTGYSNTRIEVVPQSEVSFRSLRCE